MVVIGCGASRSFWRACILVSSPRVLFTVIPFYTHIELARSLRTIIPSDASYSHMPTMRRIGCRARGAAHHHSPKARASVRHGGHPRVSRGRPGQHLRDDCPPHGLRCRGWGPGSGHDGRCSSISAAGIGRRAGILNTASHLASKPCQFGKAASRSQK